jgi:hypothetical protein
MENQFDRGNFLICIVLSEKKKSVEGNSGVKKESVPSVVDCDGAPLELSVIPTRE